MSAALTASAGLWLSGCGRRLEVPSTTGHRLAALPPSARLITPDHTDYEVWRRAMIWQSRKTQARPAAIVRVGGAQDVADVLSWAQRQRLRVAVKSGGHHLWGSTLREGAVTLDLALLSDVAVDGAAGRVAVGPALWSRELARALTAEGLAFPVAHCATVPMGGYLLGGGFGINGDEWGSLACFQVEAADVVTADGRQRHVTASSDPDLFWALRGGGNGFFGVVTRYYLRTSPLPGHISESVYVFPLERAAEVARLAAAVAAQGLRNTCSSGLAQHRRRTQPSLYSARRCLCRQSGTGENYPYSVIGRPACGRNAVRTGVATHHNGRITIRQH